MQKKKPVSYLLDFDSTFIKIEGLDALAEVSLENHPHKETLVKQIKELTNLGMEGKISFEESLKKRIALLQSDKSKIEKVSKILKRNVSESILRNKTFFEKNKNNIYVISGGFKELILPVVKSFGIPSEHVYANTFTYDDHESVTGIDESNPMSKDQGKVRTVRSLKLKKDLYIIGDGYTDYELRKLGLAKKFIAFTENVARKNVVTKADQIAETFDEFLYVNKLPRTLSYPKNRISAALVDEISHEEIQLFEKEGYKVFTKPTKEELLKASIICTSQNSIKRVPIDSVHALAIGFYTNHLLNETYTSHGIAVFSKKNVAKRIIAYINSGTTAHSTSLPNLQLPRYKSSHRLLHIHKNVPGMLAQINDVMASHDINILGQYLRTNEQIGYVIIDVDKEYDSGVIKALRSIPDTIRFRVLY